jgi:hypothetical protein
MEWPYMNPPADVIVHEAENLRHLSFEERFDRLMEVIRAGEAYLDSHPDVQEKYRRDKEQSELAWQRAHREISARFGF